MTYHDSLQALTNTALALLAFVDGLAQSAELLLVLAELNLGLLAAQHGALEGGIGRLTLELLGLHGYVHVVELADLVEDRGGRVALLVHAILGDGAERAAGWSGRLAGIRLHWSGCVSRPDLVIVLVAMG